MSFNRADKTSADPEISSRRGFPWSLLILVVIIVLGATGIFLLGSRKQQETSSVTLPVDDVFTLKLKAVLTDTNPNYNEPDSVLSKILSWLPKIRGRPIFGGGSAHNTISYPGLKVGDAKLLLGIEYPKSMRSSRTVAQVSQDLQDALKRSGVSVFRVGHGPGSFSGRRSVNYHNTSPGYGISHNEFHPMLILDLDCIPLYAKDLNIQFLSSWNDTDTSVKISLTVPNPYHQHVDPLPPGPLPATVAHGDIQVTLRAVVSKITSEISFRRNSGDRKKAELVNDKPFPDSGALPVDVFPRSAGTDSDTHHSATVFDISRNGHEQTEWGIDQIDIAYGKRHFPMRINSWSTDRHKSTHVVSFPGDLSLAKQPLEITAVLERRDNFPADEQKVVEVPLPPKGEANTPKVLAKMWDGTITVDTVSHNKLVKIQSSAGGSSIQLETNPSLFCVVLDNSQSTADISDMHLLGADGTSVSMTMQRRGTYTSNYLAIYSYDVSAYSDGSEARPLEYDKFTSMAVTLTRPRKHPGKFSFVAVPTDAEGIARPKD